MSPWPGRAPLEVGVGWPLDGGEAVDEQLGFLVLQEVEREVVDLDPAMGRQGLERVLARAERVHEHERQQRAGLAPGVLHLAHDQVEEGLVASHREQRLGAVHAHRGAEPAVELDDGGLGERLARGVLVHVDLIEVRGVGQRLDRVLENQACGARLELSVIVAEHVDCGLAHARLDHLGLGCDKSWCVGHAPSLGMPLSRRETHRVTVG